MENPGIAFTFQVEGKDLSITATKGLRTLKEVIKNPNWTSRSSIGAYALVGALRKMTEELNAPTMNSCTEDDYDLFYKRGYGYIMLDDKIVYEKIDERLNNYEMYKHLCRHLERT